MKRNTIWIIIIVLVAIVLFLLPSLFMYGRSGWTDGYGMMGGSGMMGGYGMMGGWMFLGWLIPVGILILVIAGGVWLGNTLSNRNSAPPAAPARTCSNCGKPVAADWKTCPYCGTPLE